MAMHIGQASPGIGMLRPLASAYFVQVDPSHFEVTFVLIFIVFPLAVTVVPHNIESGEHY